ncbi:MAG: hypothetical protein HC909_00305, partial [Blastochloris sp.]|nr:hypothetical protein [Blastochloris sp.]
MAKPKAVSLRAKAEEAVMESRPRAAIEELRVRIRAIESGGRVAAGVLP